VLFDLAGRTTLRLTGADRVRYLNGQVTNDVRKANSHLAMAACVLSAKGKIDALVYILGGDEELILDADPELRETLPPRLERYIIADDVTLEDVSSEFALFHQLGEAPPVLAGEPKDWRRSRRFGQPGWDLLVAAADHERARQALAAQESFSAPEMAEQFRIEQGVPRWGAELNDQIIPVEANLEADAIDYAKGCYIGQEVISRMKMSGQTNKRLYGLVSRDGTPLRAGERLLAPSSGKDAGWITSAVRSDSLGKEIALGYVKRGFNAPGTELLAPGPVEVVAPPFR
jgi:tRNA-modifying protein YgfZ